MPLTSFFNPLFRRPSFLFLGAAEDPPDDEPPPPEEELPDEEDPLEEEEELPDDEEDPPEEEPPSDDEEEEEGFPPGPYLPLSYPFFAAPLTALAALCAVPTALAVTPTVPCTALPAALRPDLTLLAALLTLESVDAFFSEEPLTFCLLTFSFVLAAATFAGLVTSLRTSNSASTASQITLSISSMSYPSSIHSRKNSSTCSSISSSVKSRSSSVKPSRIVSSLGA